MQADISMCSTLIPNGLFLFCKGQIIGRNRIPSQQCITCLGECGVMAQLGFLAMGLTPHSQRLILPPVRHGQLNRSILIMLAVYKSDFFYCQSILGLEVLGVPVTLEGWDAEEDACTGSYSIWSFVHMALHLISFFPF